MKIRFYLATAIVALSWMGCSQEEATNEIVNGDVTLQDMLDFKASDGDIETEDDSEVLDVEFETETSSNKIIRKED